MALRRMIDEEAALARIAGGDGTIEIDRDYPGAHGPLYMATTHEGLVLRLGEYNGYNDSDFYAEVWSEEEGKPVNVVYGSTRGWTYPNNAWVDATPEVEAKAEEYRKGLERAHREIARKKEAATPRAGKHVRVVKGRKVPRGTEGRVFWFGFKWGHERVGFKDAAGETFWTAATNVEVIQEGGE